MRRVGPVVGLGLAVALWTALLPTSLDGLWPWPPPEVGSTKRISQSYGRFMRAPLIIIGLPISIRHPARRTGMGGLS